MPVPNCPKCGASLKDEYGMSQCPACGTFSFIDMDGNAVISEPSQSIEPGGAAAPPDFADPIEGLIDTPAMDFSFAADENETSETPVTHEFEPVDMFAPMEPLETPASSDNASVANDIAAEAPAFGPANDPLNLNEFANSEVSSAKDGPLLFRVLISGIDAKEIRESIREVLQDSRFAWDPQEIFSKVSHGRLTITGLSPVKASILITRIKRLPITIRWEQYAITQGPSTEHKDV